MWIQERHALVKNSELFSFSHTTGKWLKYMIKQILCCTNSKCRSSWVEHSYIYIYIYTTKILLCISSTSMKTCGAQMEQFTNNFILSTTKGFKQASRIWRKIRTLSVLTLASPKLPSLKCRAATLFRISGGMSASTLSFRMLVAVP